MASVIFLLLITLFSFSPYAAASSKTLSNAAEVLSDSGYLSMALTLQLTSTALGLESSAATIFAPTDSAFARSGQPSLFQLRYHISPTRYAEESFKALPYGARIPTQLSNYSLIITTANNYNAFLTINDVLVQESPLFDDGSLVIYGVGEFFDFSFEISPDLLSPAPSPGSSTGQGRGPLFDDDIFSSASDLLISRGYTKMATFLEAQLGEFSNRTRLTIFAPSDESIEAYVKNFTDYSLIVRRHIVPCLLPSKDLGRLDEGTILQTFSGGFTINVTKSGDILLLNDVPVIYPDMYVGELLVAHGVNQLIISSQLQLIEESLSELDGDYERNPPAYDEYGIP